MDFEEIHTLKIDLRYSPNQNTECNHKVYMNEQGGFAFVK